MADGDREGAAGDEKVSIRRLPQLRSTLFGRAGDTAWLDACWAERAHVATIVAPGGVGKSALVWDWLRRMAADGWRGAERVFGWSFYGQGLDRRTSVGRARRRGAAVVRGRGSERRVAVGQGGAAGGAGEPAAGDPGAGRGGAAPARAGGGAGQAQGSRVAGAREGAGGAEQRALRPHHPAPHDGSGSAGRGRGAEHVLGPLSAEAGAELLEAAGATGSKEESASGGPRVRRARPRAGATRVVPAQGAPRGRPEARSHPAARRQAGAAHDGDVREMAREEARDRRLANARASSTDLRRPTRPPRCVRSPRSVRADGFLEGPPRPPPHAWEKAVATLRDVGLVAPASETRRTSSTRTRSSAHTSPSASAASTRRRGGRGTGGCTST